MLPPAAPLDVGAEFAMVVEFGALHGVSFSVDRSMATKIGGARHSSGALMGSDKQERNWSGALR